MRWVRTIILAFAIGLIVGLWDVGAFATVRMIFAGVTILMAVLMRMEGDP